MAERVQARGDIVCKVSQLRGAISCHIFWFLGVFPAVVQRFSYDLEMKTRQQNRNNKRTEIEQFDWFIERIQTHLAFGWLRERSAEKTSCPKNFLEIALTSYCNTIDQSNNAFSILGFYLAGKRRVHVLFFSTNGWWTNNEHLPKPFFKDIRKSL